MTAVLPGCTSSVSERVWFGSPLQSHLYLLQDSPSGIPSTFDVATFYTQVYFEIKRCLAKVYKIIEVSKNAAVQWQCS